MSGLRVLLIGGEEAESQHILTALSKANYAVLPVPSFDEASEALLIQKFDAVLITRALAGGRVADFTAHLREAEKSQRNAARTAVLSVPPNSLAGSGVGGVATASGNGSVDAYLPQQFDPAGFAETVENLALAVAQSNEGPANDMARSELPVFDEAEFRAQVAHDSDLMAELINLFLEERTHDVMEMSEALAARDFGKLTRAAHTIKGSLGSLHADRARQRAQEIETAAKSRREQPCVELLSAFEEDLNELEPQLLALRASVQG